MLAQHLEGIELLVARQRLGLRDAGAEPLPRDHRGDGREGVPLAIVGTDQGGADLGEKAHLVIDGAPVGLESPGMVAFGLAKHRPDQPVEEIDGLVGQAGAKVQRDGHQRGVAALPLQAGEVLHGGSASLAGQVGQAPLVNAMALRRVDADFPDMGHAFHEAEHGRRLGRFRHLAQPCQPALAGVGPALRQRVQTFALLGGQPLGQAVLDLPPGLLADLDAQPFERPWRRDGDPALPAFLQHPAGEMGEPVVLDRVRQQPFRQLGRRTGSERTQPDPFLRLGGMPSAGPRCGQIVFDAVRKNVDLLGEERNEGGRRALVDLQGPPRIAQIAEHQRKAETVVVAPASADQGKVAGGQRVMTHQVTPIGRRVEQRGGVGFGQLRTAGHSGLPVVGRREPSRSGPTRRSRCCA